MGWETSNRLSRLPRDWQARRLRALVRDGYRCQHRDAERGLLCARRATDVDHVERGDDHDLANLRSLCSWHHGQKSGREGAAARAERDLPRRRPAEVHPADR